MKKWMYYAIQWTWGLPMNILGIMAFCICGAIDGIWYLFKRQHIIRFYKYRNAICTVLPWNFGGFNMGMFFVRGRDNEGVCPHEYGHGIQNLWWGLLFPIVIMIPSVARYWYREAYYRFIYPKNRKKLPRYDSIWFENQATQLGNFANAGKWSWM